MIDILYDLCYSIIMALRFIKRTYNRMFLAKDPRPPYASHVVQIGDPVLRNKASQVPLEKIGTKEVQNVRTFGER